MVQEKIRIGFGALAPSLKKQLDEQRFRYDKSAIDHFQKDADAITRLRVRGLMPAGEVEKERKKLVNKIAAHVELYVKKTPKTKQQ